MAQLDLFHPGMRRAPAVQTVIPLDGNRFYQGLFQSITGSPHRSFTIQLPGIDKSSQTDCPTVELACRSLPACLPLPPTKKG